MRCYFNVWHRGQVIHTVTYFRIVTAAQVKRDLVADGMPSDIIVAKRRAEV